MRVGRNRRTGYPWAKRRRCWRRAQSFMMTGMPAASALAFASSLITPSCIQMYLAPTSMASSTTGMTWSERRKTSTMSMGFGKRT